MPVNEILKRAMDRGQRALSEYESKLLLAEYGLPVTREGLAHSPDEAAALAGEIGYPVVLKACSPDLMHKSEGGFVELGLRDETAVRDAYTRLIGKAPAVIEGVLVQEMVRGKRELVLGLTRDPQFGPMVMAGLGGVLTEIFEDTAFRMAPIDEIEALDMLDELRCRRMLDDFRGEATADLTAVARGLVALGRVGLERPEIAEIDVNPLIVGPDGRPAAADALVVLKGTHNA